MQRLIVAVALIVVLASGITLHAWWSQAHHCTTRLGEQVCGEDRYLPMLPGGF